MKKQLLLLPLLILVMTGMSHASTIPHKDIVPLEAQYKALKQEQTRLKQNISTLRLKSHKQEENLQRLQKEKNRLQQTVDSLCREYNELKTEQVNDRDNFNKEIEQTNQTVQENHSILTSRTWWISIVGFVLLLIVFVAAYYLLKKLRNEKNSINEVQKAQEALRSAQNSMQEESVKLDNKLIEIMEKQISNMKTSSTDSANDHSLALKVADEITRMEINLSRMDSSIKGYKQLLKAVERIKDNFRANGYEIVEMLGKPYNEGMKATVTFVTDENMAKGQQIITKIIKPQINYQQQMIQAAQIEVSQSE